MTYKFRPAVRDKTAILLGLAGPSRSGKTYSALRIATGIARVEGGDIAFIDTERGRALQYADRFKFLHANLEPPFSSARYEEAIMDAVAIKPAVIIVDSASHEHEGPGGILEQHEEILKRMAGDDWRKRDKLKFTAWIEPKQAHNRYVNTLLQLNTHFIFCFRAKDKLALIKNEQGKIEPTAMGWTPICTDRFEYEMTSLLVLPEGSKGTPDFRATSTGLREPLDTMIKPGEQLTEAVGERLAQWARGPKKESEVMPDTEDGRSSSEPSPHNAEPPSSEAGASLRIPVQASFDGADWLGWRDAWEVEIEKCETMEQLKALKADNVDALKNCKAEHADAYNAIVGMLKGRMGVLETEAA